MWNMFYLDVKYAFLNGLLEEKIYVYHPEGSVVEGGWGKESLQIKENTLWTQISS